MCDKNLIEMTWHCFKAHKRENGVKIFIRLFNEHLEYRDLFDKLKGTEKEDWASNDYIWVHGGKAVDGIDEMVKSLGENEKFKKVVEANARDHSGRGVKPEYFMDFCKAIIDVVREASRDHFTSDAEDAWKDMLENRMYGIIQSTAGKYNQK